MRLIQTVGVWSKHRMGSNAPPHTVCQSSFAPAPAPARLPCSIAVHKRFWRPQECLSLISAADMDAKDVATLVRSGAPA